MTIRSMKKQRAELVALVAECEAVWEVANGLGHHEAEAHATAGVSAAGAALAGVDTKDFEDVAADVKSARTQLALARALLRRGASPYEDRARRMNMTDAEPLATCQEQLDNAQDAVHTARDTLHEALSRMDAAAGRCAADQLDTMDAVEHRTSTLRRAMANLRAAEEELDAVGS